MAVTSITVGVGAHALRMPGGAYAPVPGVWRCVHTVDCPWYGYWEPLAWSYLDFYRERKR